MLKIHFVSGTENILMLSFTNDTIFSHVTNYKFNIRMKKKEILEKKIVK